jgi:hypothetical protein
MYSAPMPEVGSSAWHPEGMSLLRCHQAAAAAGGIGMGPERIIPQPANCGLGDLLYVIERVMNVYQPVFPLFIWSFQEKSVILRRN